MFEARKKTASNRKTCSKTWLSAFMRKFFICMTLITLMLTFSVPVFAAESDGLSYSGNSYWATVKYGLNLRDKDGDFICYLESGTDIYVLGVHKDDSSRIVVEYGNTVGTVLRFGVKKSSNQFNEGLEYSGSSYYATVKYGLNLRDKNGNIVCYLKSGTNVYVLGVSKDDSSRVVVKYNDITGTVLKVGLKKSTTNGNQHNTKLEYSGKSYYGKVKYYINVRDEKNNIIGKVTKDEVVHVLGIYDKNSSRVVIEWNNSKGTVLRTGLAEVFYSGESYYAVTRNGLNMRDTNGNLICYIPKNNLVYVKGVSTQDKTRVVVKYNGTEGTILKGGVKEIKDAIFVNITSQKTILIKDGKIIAESKCVTGRENKSDTPCGAFKVTEMKKDKTLRGQNYDGSLYAKPVDYWIRFYRGCGFHDAKWRSFFGGKIYQSSGSYGCVNLPHKFAKTLYENTYVGMPVYIA